MYILLLDEIFPLQSLHIVSRIYTLDLSVQSLALCLQLQVLIDDSQRLQETYPGGNVEHIAQQQGVVLENWKILQERTAQRKDDLRAAQDLYRFLAAVSWHAELVKWVEF